MTTYFGLRAYGTNPQIWGGAQDCAHAWGEAVLAARMHSQRNGQGATGLQPAQRATENLRDLGTRPTGASCLRCSAWRGELGSEPTVEQFTANMVEVFRQVRRVLHPSGSLWLNLGASYAGSGKGPSNSMQRPQSCLNNRQLELGAAPTEWRGISPGYKAKDLIATPFLVAEALRQDGWWLRSMCPWLKFSAMPESVTDRPATSIEWVMLLTPSPTYYYDATAVRKPYLPESFGRYQYAMQGTAPTCRQPGGDVERRIRELGIRDPNPDGRNRRNGDWLAESIPDVIQSLREQADHLEAVWSGKGLLTDEQGDPLAFLVNPEAYAAEHFATFPLRLVQPCIKASTSEHGQCAECGAPWERMVSEEQIVKARNVAPEKYEGGRDERGGTWTALMAAQTRKRVDTLGWQPTCRHDAPIVPQTVLDPFLGSGTTLLAARRLGRNGIGIELNQEYAAQAEKRIAGHRPRRAAPQATPLGPLFQEETA